MDKNFVVKVTIEMLEAQKVEIIKKIDEIIADLKGSAPKASRTVKRSMSDADRKKRSLAMKKAWATRRKKDASKKKG